MQPTAVLPLVIKMMILLLHYHYPLDQSQQDYHHYYHLIQGMHQEYVSAYYYLPLVATATMVVEVVEEEYRSIHST